MYSKSWEVVDRRELLKIKLKSLAAEAQIIRKEEKKIGTIRYVKVPIEPSVFTLKPEDAEKRRDINYRCAKCGESERKHIHNKDHACPMNQNRPHYWRRVRISSNPLAHEMWAHRTHYLREESRLTGIAYGLVRGRSIERIEHYTKKPLSEAQWERIYKMVEKYGSVAQLAALPPSKRKAA